MVELQEAAQAVANINEDIDKIYVVDDIVFDKFAYPRLYFTGNQDVVTIYFEGIRLWRSDEDERNVDSNEEYTETIEKFVRRQLYKYVTTLRVLMTYV